MRFTDFMLALPLLPMYLFATRLIRTSPGLGPWLDANPVLGTLGSIAIVFVLFGWMGIARLVRGSFLTCAPWTISRRRGRSGRATGA